MRHVVDDAAKLLLGIEREAREPFADILLVADVINLLQAHDKGLLAKVHSRVVEQAVPAELRDEDWFAPLNVRVLVYAKDRVLPTDLDSYEALARPEWRNRILVRSSNSTYNQSLTAFLLVKHGEQEVRRWVQGLVENMARMPQGGDTDQIRGVAAGEADVAIANSYYFARLLASNVPSDIAVAEKVEMFFPGQDEDGVMTNVSGAGVLRNAPNRENAIAFLEFMVSPEAQRIYAQVNHEYPVVQGVEISEILGQYGEPEFDIAPLKKLGAYTRLAAQIADEEGWK